MTSALPAQLSARATADPVKVSGFGQTQSPPRDLNACFAEFLRRVVPTSPAYVAAKAAATEIATDLRAELYKGAHLDVSQTDHIVVGSVGKRTATAPIQTVDLLYALPPKLAIRKAVDGLKTAWAVLKSKYPSAEIAADSTGVLIARESITVKVLTCLPHEGAFLVPGVATVERAAGWSITNPIAEAATLRLMDSMYANRPRLMMAALKAWRIHSAVPLASFALELLVQDFYTSAPRPFDLATALVDFWAWAKKRTPATLKPPGASTAVVIDNAWHGKAKAAYWRASLAQHHIAQNKVVDAALEWRQTLGPLFPIAGEQTQVLPLFGGKQHKASAA